MTKDKQSESSDFEMTQLEEEMIIVSTSFTATNEPVETPLEEFQETIGAKLDAAIKAMDSLKVGSQDSTADLKEIKADSKEIKSELKKLNENLMSASKFQRLEWAIDHADIGSFKYFEKGNPKAQDSTEVAKLVLLGFRRGCACNLNVFIEGQEAENFMKEFPKQIQQLTGVKPRMIPRSAGNFAIHYS
jgi:hypothetical protein